MAEGALRAALLRHLVLQVGEALLQLFLALTTKAGLIRLACLPEEGGGDVAVAGGILLQVILVVLLSAVEVPERHPLHRYRLAVLSAEPVQCGGHHRLIGGVAVVDPRAVLRAAVVALTIDRRRVYGEEEDLQQLCRRQHLRVVDHPDGLGVARLVATDDLVRGVGGIAIGIPHFRLQHAADLAEEVLRPPEASAGEVDLSLIFAHLLLGLSPLVTAPSG